MPRKKAAKAEEASDGSEDEQNFVEDDGDNEDGMLEMIAMLQEFQKRKSGKNSSKSAAFQAKKEALFAEARKNAGNAVKDGVAFIEQCKTKIAELKVREMSQAQHLKDLALFQSREDAINATIAVFPPMLDELSHRRAEAINEISAMLEAHSVARHHSRRRLIRQAKARLEEDQEKQRVATDASALIKHYKTLLLS